MKTSKRTHHQTLPASGEEREELREKGQFWTPSWVSEAMVSYAVAGGATTIFDPAVGEGAFFRAAKVVAQQLERPLILLGVEIDPSIIEKARQNGLTQQDVDRIHIGDFLLGARSKGIPLSDADIVSEVPNEPMAAIVANPPYIRHHRLTQETKSQLQKYVKYVTDTTLDGRAGYHVYFLIHALTLLQPEGRLAFIMPADTVEGVFAPKLWKWITTHYLLDAVITFAPKATPFPGVDTNAVVLMLRNAKPVSEFWWAQCGEPETDDLKAWVCSHFIQTPLKALTLHRRTLTEGLATGLSRPPQDTHTGSVLADFASVMRGIATGDNDFFFLTKSQATQIGIPNEFLLRAIGRTRDIAGDATEVTSDTLQTLDDAGRPTYLFSPDGRAFEKFPPSVRCYLEEGLRRRLPDRALIGMRNPWYKMEIRKPPPFLFAYLGRRNVRFIRNYAGVVPLTGFLCIYCRDGISEDALWTVLNYSQTVTNLARVGKSYGDGAIKVEPRAMDRLPLPPEIVAAAGLEATDRLEQLALIAD